MKREDLISLSYIENMRMFIENQGMFGATDLELQEFINIYEGHGYEMCVKDLKEDCIYRIDVESVKEPYQELKEDENYTIDDIGYALSHAYEMNGELIEEYETSEHINLREDKEDFNMWKEVCEQRLQLSNLYSRLYDKNNKNSYIVTLVQRSFTEPEDSIITDVYDNEVEVYEDVLNVLNVVLRKEDIKDYSGEYELEDDFDIAKFKFESREMKEIHLTHSTGEVIITVATKDNVKKDKMEFYMVVEKYRNDVSVEHSTDIFHFKTKAEAQYKFKDIVEGWKIDKEDSIEEIIENGTYINGYGYMWEGNEYYCVEDRFVLIDMYDSCKIEIEVYIEKVVL